MIPTFVFDIETGPLPDDQLEKFLPPFDLEKLFPPITKFHPNQVKIGNLKDKAKIKTKIEKARDEYRNKIDSREQDMLDAEADHFNKFRDKAALSPTTGQVLAVGIFDGLTNLYLVNDNQDEKRLIRQYWDWLDAWQKKANTHRQIGFHIFGFDLPFLVRRSWVHGIKPSSCVGVGKPCWNPWAPCFVDLLEEYQLGNRRDYIKLAELSIMLGGKGKPEDTDGGDFSRLFHGTEAERQEAIDYLGNDLAMTWHVASQLGFVK
jgi:hypothetical protein